ncbi:MAG: helix-turn-helix domain-containing protein [Defluviitaleaceae bacterium]|nr:helix-turn-helix domain-containing protein [Defluviitaleaceae bacterium]
MNPYKDRVFNKENLGKTIKKYRLAYDLSVNELAELLGLSATFVGLIERGERGVSLKNMVCLTKIFDVDINELVYDTGESLAVKLTLEERKLKSLYALLTGLNERELRYIMANVENLKILKNKD